MVLTWIKKTFDWLMSVAAASLRPAFPFDFQVDSQVREIRLREGREVAETVDDNYGQ